MAFEIKEKQFGDFKEFILTNDNKESISIIPDYGANWKSLVLKSATNQKLYSLIDGYNTPEELIALSYSKSIVLLPFPNRIRNGAYTFGDKAFQLPINKVNEGNAIHGLVNREKWQVSNMQTSENEATIIVDYIYDGKKEAYPFAYKASLIYTLYHNGCKISTVLQNIGDSAMPIGLGFHPYFRFEGVSADELELSLPKGKKIEVDEKMIPTGILSDYPYFQEELNIIGETKFDTGFELQPIHSKSYTHLKNPKDGVVLSVWQNTADFQYLQIFIPPSRASVAIEPMTCATDAFNNGRGLLILSQNELVTKTFGVELS